MSTIAHIKPVTTHVGVTLDFFARGLEATASELEAGLPECRERSLALTKIQEAWFWTQQAILEHQDHFSPGLAEGGKA